jgi:hypothetical protein
MSDLVFALKAVLARDDERVGFGQKILDPFQWGQRQMDHPPTTVLEWLDVNIPDHDATLATAWWRQPNTYPRVVPFTSFPGQSHDRSFSPDGNQIRLYWRERMAHTGHLRQTDLCHQPRCD